MAAGRQPQRRRVLAYLFRFDFLRDGALQPLQLYSELLGHFGSSSFLVLQYAFERAGKAGVTANAMNPYFFSILFSVDFCWGTVVIPISTLESLLMRRV